MPEPTWRLSVQRGPQAGRVHALSSGSVTMGRMGDNDIVVDYPTVSRHHARLTWQGQAYLIQDLGTVNGTSVNGVRIDAPTLLRPGDTIGLGPTVVLSVGVEQRSAAPGAYTAPVPPPTAPPTAPPGAAPARAPGAFGRTACLVSLGAALAVTVIAVLAVGAWYLFIREP